MVLFFEIADPIVWWHFVLVGLAFACASFIIGLFGLGGGVVYVPALLQVPGISATSAVSTVMMSTMPMSVFRCGQLHFVYKRIRWRAAAPMMVGAGISAFIGQVILKYIPQAVVLSLVGATALYTGVKVVYDMRKAKRAAQAKEAQKQAEELRAKQLEELKLGQACGGDQDNTPSTVASTSYEKSQAADASPQDSATPVGTDADPDSLAAPASVTLQMEEEGNQKGEEASEKPAVDAGAEKIEASAPATAAPAKPADKDGEEELSVPPLKFFAIGLVAGLISSVGGLGGPIVVFPLMLLFTPVPMRVMLGITSPVALTIVTISGGSGLIFSDPDVGVAAVFAVINTGFTLLGGYCQERMASATLKAFVAWLLLGLGLLILAKTAADEVL
eukprot:TRINITY_DN30286_c0_g1_i1.p1 TRINITY_DN30286_c0_g1~~TRINITY_DN30286_c0_g1_i1.p1  ORF type:complete len:389 (-),score=105.12 TRINITY_DN30286_c0_g1_i1:153-1319(-)